MKEIIEKIDRLIREIEMDEYLNEETLPKIREAKGLLNTLHEQLNIANVSNRFSDPKFIDNVCLSYRHDFGLLSEDEQNKVKFECKEWMRAIKNNEPY